MSTINREQAIAIIDELNVILFFEANEHSREAYKEIRTAIEHLPTAEKTGKWIHDYDDVLVSGICSVCGWRSIIMETDVADMPYCPNCGARMK